MKKSLIAGTGLILLASCAPSKTMAPVYSYGVKPGVGSLGAHTVRAGDTVWTVSQKYNLELRDVIEVNHLSPPYALKAGTRLNLPAPQTYTVHGRDSLYSISRLFNTTQTELAALNKLSSPYKLTGGQVLRIPKTYKTAELAAPPPSMQVPAMSTPIAASPAAVETASLPPPEGQVQSGQMPPQPEAPAPSASAAPAEMAVVNNVPVPKRTGRFLKPVAGKIISGFGDKADGQHNDGINIQAIKGDPVRAAENGKVVYVGNEISGYGNMILIRHQDQYMTAYAHLGKMLVKKGDIVKVGQAIGTVGSTGFVDKPQLHFEIRKGKTAVDPAGLI